MVYLSFLSLDNQNKPERKITMANFYCEFCGQKFLSVSSLTASVCARHPLGNQKGKHKLYEGPEKAKYTCKYCGQQFNSISSMTATPCSKHPNGNQKGRHAPAL